MNYSEWKILAVILLALSGFAISCYIFQASVFGGEIICGPLIYCNEVLRSVYSRIMGIPVSLFGAAAYLSLLLIGLFRKYRSGRVVSKIDLAAYGISLTGFLYSVYAVFIQYYILETFCIWCISSAVIITLIFVITAIDVTSDLSFRQKKDRVPD